MVNLIGLLLFASVCLGAAAVHRMRMAPAEPAPAEPAPSAEPGGLDRGGFARPGLGERLETAAAQAGLDWTGQFFAACGLTGAGLGLLLMLGGAPIWGLMTAAAGAAGPILYVKHRQAGRAARFAEQLPQALFLAASVLRAGGSMMQAVDAIATEIPAPLGAEFALIRRQMQLQVPAHEAMAAAWRRVGVREFAAVVVAARITAEVGGNLAHLFDQIARAITDAQNARRTVRAFTTEGRLSANLIAALPVVVLGVLHLLSPGYFQPMLATWPGRLLLGGSLLTIGLGWLLIRRMVDIRIH